VGGGESCTGSSREDAYARARTLGVIKLRADHPERAFFSPREIKRGSFHRAVLSLRRKRGFAIVAYCRAVNNFSDAETFVINYSRVISELYVRMRGGRRRSEMIRNRLV